MKDSEPPADFTSYLAKVQKARFDAAHYILDGHTAVPADTHTWHRWFQTADRVVEQTQLGADTTVSTVFIGFDQDQNPARPAIFETEISNTGNESDKRIVAADGFRLRYATWEEAAASHRSIVALLTAMQKYKRPYPPPISNPLGASSRAEEIGEQATDFIFAVSAMIADLKAKMDAECDPQEPAGGKPDATSILTDLRFLNAIVDASAASLSEMWGNITSLRSKVAARTHK